MEKMTDFQTIKPADITQNPRANQKDILPYGVKSWNIQTINFDQAFGGTLTLGGNNNVDGTLKVLDASGVEKGTWDKDGITILDGTVTIKSTDGDNVIDSNGVVSVTQFLNGDVFDNNLQTTTSVSYVDVTGTTIAFTLEREANVFVEFDSVTQANSGAAGSIALNVNGVNFVNAFFPSINAGANSITVSSALIGTFDPGVQTLKMQFNSFTGGQVSVIGSSISYIILGK